MSDFEDIQLKKHQGVDPAYKVKELTWIRLWFWYFQANTDYSYYCAAKRDGDELTTERLGREYREIHKLYDDWDDIYLNEKGERIKFDDWIKTHMSLFFPNSGTVNLIQKEEFPSHATVISVPHSVTKAHATNQIEKLLSERTRKGYHVPLTPKYSIYPNGKLRKDESVALYKALKAYRFLELIKAGSKKITTNPEIVEEIITGKKLNTGKDIFFDWEFSDDAQKRHESGELTGDDIDNEVSQIKRYQRYAAPIIANTIRGFFPQKDNNEQPS